MDRPRCQGAVYIEPKSSVIVEHARDEMPVSCEIAKVEGCALKVIIVAPSNAKEESIRFLVPS
jgi:hypothetical protein